MFHILQVSYFSAIGGKDVNSQVNNILRRLFTNELAKQFSFYGKRGDKKAFSTLKTKDLIVGNYLTSLNMWFSFDCNAVVLLTFNCDIFYSKTIKREIKICMNAENLHEHMCVMFLLHSFMFQAQLERVLRNQKRRTSRMR